MRRLIFVTLGLCCLVSCGGRRGVENNARPAASTAEPAMPVAAVAEPTEYGCKIVNTYPHAENAYTQGLFWHDGFLYEGTGQRGESRLRRVVLETGEAVQELNMDNRYFGEGITLHNGKIYQITWMSGQAFVYDTETFRLLKTFRYDGEGWGLVSDGEVLYMSDGSDKIFVRDPETFGVLRTVSVRRGRNALQNINEMEWIDGRLWANVYLTDTIVIINPETGAVEGEIDLSGLRAPQDITGRSDVLNGIAYDGDSDRLFVTGKYWNKLYQIEISEKK